MEAHLEIPQNEISKAHDRQVDKVRAFLEDPANVPGGLSGQELQRFMKHAGEYFVTGDQLWKKHSQG